MSVSTRAFLDMVVSHCWSLLTSFFEDLRERASKDQQVADRVAKLIRLPKSAATIPAPTRIDLQRALYEAPIYDLTVHLVGTWVQGGATVLLNEDVIAAAADRLDREELTDDTGFEGPDLELVLGKVGESLLAIVSKGHGIAIATGDGVCTLRYDAAARPPAPPSEVKAPARRGVDTDQPPMGKSRD